MALLNALDKLIAAVAEVATAARTDEMTGLKNGLALREDAEKSISTIGNTDNYIFGDLNGFKYINDNVSHEAGDIVICYAAKRIAELCQKWQARGYRKSGDEFVILAPSSCLDGLLADLQQEFVECRVPFPPDQRTLKFSACFGVTSMEDSDISTVEERAEQACKRAKYSDGSGVVCRWSTGLTNFSTSELRIRCSNCGVSCKCTIPSDMTDAVLLHCPVCKVAVQCEQPHSHSAGVESNSTGETSSSASAPP